MGKFSIAVRALAAAVLLTVAGLLSGQAGPATRLQLLLPGELAAPGTTSGKTGTPRLQIAGAPLNVTVNAVDANWNVVTTVNDLLLIGSSDPKAAVPPTVRLAGGTATFTAMFNLPGNWTISAQDSTDPTKAGGTSSSVSVLSAGAAEIAVAKLPGGMVAAAGTAGAIDSYLLVNKGGTPARVNVTQIGVFFFQTPSDFTLAPGQSQLITITSTAQPPGVYEGMALLRGESVPAGLEIPVKLVSDSPAADPVVQATVTRLATTEKDTVVFAEFRNSGNATARGAVVSDALWLVPPSGAVFIEPGQTAQVRLQLDRSRRADTEVAYGSQSGRIDFIYATQSGRGSASVAVVDTVVPKALRPAVIAAPAPSDTSRFILGLSARDGSIADLSFANALSQSTSPDVTVYFIPAGGSSFFARALVAGPLLPAVPVELSDSTRVVFSGNAASSSVMLRSRATDEVALAATVVNRTAAGELGTAVPLFRSERAAGAGQVINLTGIRKDAATRTDLLIQETAKFNGMLQIEFFDAAGAPVGAPRAPEAIAEYGFVEIVDAAPERAVLARITNRSSSNARIIAEARVVQPGADIESIVDASQLLGVARTDRLLIPVPFDGAQARQTDVYITNVGAAAATATLSSAGSTARRRAVRTQPQSGGSLSVTLAPLQTQIVRGAARSGALLELTPSSGGEFAVTARTYFAGGGTTIPGISAAAAVTAGGARRFAGVASAPPSSVSAPRPGTYRTAAGLIETSGAEAAVRITVRFRYEAALASALDSVSRDFAVGARQMLLIGDVVRAVIGPAGDAYGELHDVVVDVSVLGGSVIPFLVATENASGDLMFRLE